ncbi:MAG TPA: VOC family protein, partial [Candidatus Limnocylindrales bacterium]|nr:VOC family protein [Candidatus Limnocylindrales bacterium]
MDYKLEVVVVPVSDVDRAKAFYVDQVGFPVDVDSRPNENFRVVQMTPPGSGCSVTIGTGLADMAPGTLKGLQLSVAD